MTSTNVCVTSAGELVDPVLTETCPDAARNLVPIDSHCLHPVLKPATFVQDASVCPAGTTRTSTAAYRTFFEADCQVDLPAWDRTMIRSSCTAGVLIDDGWRCLTNLTDPLCDDVFESEPTDPATWTWTAESGRQCTRSLAIDPVMVARVDRRQYTCQDGRTLPGPVYDLPSTCIDPELVGRIVEPTGTTRQCPPGSQRTAQNADTVCLAADLTTTPVVAFTTATCPEGFAFLSTSTCAKRGEGEPLFIDQILVRRLKVPYSCARGFAASCTSEAGGPYRITYVLTSPTLSITLAPFITDEDTHTTGPTFLDRTIVPAGIYDVTATVDTASGADHRIAKFRADINFDCLPPGPEATAIPRATTIPSATPSPLPTVISTPTSATASVEHSSPASATTTTPTLPVLVPAGVMTPVDVSATPEATGPVSLAITGVSTIPPIIGFALLAIGAGLVATQNTRRRD